MCKVSWNTKQIGQTTANKICVSQTVLAFLKILNFLFWKYVFCDESGLTKMRTTTTRLQLVNVWNSWRDLHVNTTDINETLVNRFLNVVTICNRFFQFSRWERYFITIVIKFKIHWQRYRNEMSICVARPFVPGSICKLPSRVKGANSIKTFNLWEW